MTARRQTPAETLHVVLDDATVDRLRDAASHRGIEVEQLIVQIIHHASWGAVAASGASPSIELPFMGRIDDCEPGQTT